MKNNVTNLHEETLKRAEQLESKIRALSILRVCMEKLDPYNEIPEIADLIKDVIYARTRLADAPKELERLAPFLPNKW